MCILLAVLMCWGELVRITVPRIFTVVVALHCPVCTKHDAACLITVGSRVEQCTFQHISHWYPLWHFVSFEVEPATSQRWESAGAGQEVFWPHWSSMDREPTDKDHQPQEARERGRKCLHGCRMGSCPHLGTPGPAGCWFACRWVAWRWVAWRARLAWAAAVCCHSLSWKSSSASPVFLSVDLSGLCIRFRVLQPMGLILSSELVVYRLVLTALSVLAGCKRCWCWWAGLVRVPCTVSYAEQQLLDSALTAEKTVIFVTQNEAGCTEWNGF